MGALSRAMGLPELVGVDADERVLDHLRARSALLVLDNLEHVIEVAPLIGHVARAGPEVRVLVTSQLPLRVGGENVLALDPLPVPTGAERELSALREVASVALLSERAAAAGTGWALTEENQFDVARLCRQLEGMPLALELAAPRLRVLDAGALSRSWRRASMARSPPVIAHGLPGSLITWIRLWRWRRRCGGRALPATIGIVDGRLWAWLGMRKRLRSRGLGTGAVSSADFAAVLAGGGSGATTVAGTVYAAGAGRDSNCGDRGNWRSSSGE